jgi:uncharacterized protein
MIKKKRKSRASARQVRLASSPVPRCVIGAPAFALVARLKLEVARQKLNAAYQRAKCNDIMKPSEALTNHRAELRQLVSRYGLSRPRVFGSALTGADTEESDLDLLVDPAGSTTLFTLAGLKYEAEKLLGQMIYPE